jgi:hypothetical protein
MGFFRLTAITSTPIIGLGRTVITINAMANGNIASKEQNAMFVDWGDGTNTSWVGTYPSGTVIITSHTWTKKGTYKIKAQASDIYGARSDWETLPVTIPYSYNLPTNSFLVKLFEQFEYAFPILRHLMGY